MGTWGYNPKDGDGPNDMVGEVINDGVTMSLLLYFLKPPTNTPDHWEKVGVVQLLSEYHYKIPFFVLKKCREYVDVCLADKDWIKKWNYPDAFVNSANDFNLRLDTIINEVGSGKRKRSGDHDLIDAPELAETKEWEPPRDPPFRIGSRV